MARPRKDAPKPDAQELALVPVEEQPYPLPDGWKWVRLGSVLYVSKEKTEDFSSSSLRYIGLEHFAKDNGIIGFSSAAEVRSLKNVFYAGQILYGKLRPYLNKHDIASFNGICSTDILVFNCKKQVVTKFVNYFFNLDFFIEYVVANSKGINLPRVSENIILNTVFPLPPLEVQQRIVDSIESLFAKLDEAREKAQTALNSFETRKAAILHKAFTGELTAKWREERGIELKKWETFTLQDVCCKKITDGTHQTPTYSNPEEGIPFISSKDVTGGVINWSNIKYITKELHNELYARLAPQLDDILLAKNGTTGIAALVDTDKVFDIYVTLALLRAEQSIIMPRYLLQIINSPICKEQFNSHLTGIGVPNLHLRDIKAVTIPVPSLPEQQEITHILDSLLKKEQQSKAAAEAVLTQIDLMKKAILAKAFRGELG